VWLVRLRRLLAVPAAVALVLGAPGLAYATFTANTGGSLAVGTYSIPAPATATGTRTCNNGNPKGITINITSFAAVSKATSYIATVTAPDGTTTSKTVDPGGFTITKQYAKAGTYTLVIQAQVANWTGAALPQTYAC
jgi:hypothetical protein